jgi:hypothetical protein
MPSTDQRDQANGALMRAPKELRDLAAIELTRRRLLSELADVRRQHRQLSRQIELKAIPIPRLNKI